MIYAVVALAVAGIGGAITLGIYIARMAQQNRSDLKTLVSATKTIGERNRDTAVRIERFKGLQDALDEKDKELARANAAIDEAYRILSAASGPGRDGVNAALDRLRVLQKMSAAKETTTAEDRDGDETVHEAAASGSREAGT